MQYADWLRIFEALVVLCLVISVYYLTRILKALSLVLEGLRSQFREIDGLRNENRTLKRVAGLPDIDTN